MASPDLKPGPQNEQKAAFILTNGLWRTNIDVTDRKDDDDHGILTPTHALLACLSFYLLRNVCFIDT